MDRTADVRAEAAWEIACEVVDMIRWDREEQRAEAVVEIAVVVEAGLKRFAAAHRGLEVERALAAGRN